MLKDIKLAINEKILSIFPEVEIQSKDIEEGFKRPSFYVDFENSKLFKIAAEYYNKSISVKVYYFASDRYKHSTENLEVQESLESLFIDKLVVNEVNIPILEVESNVVDSVLQFSFELEYNINKVEEYDNEISEILETDIKN